MREVNDYNNHTVNDNDDDDDNVIDTERQSLLTNNDNLHNNYNSIFCNESILTDDEPIEYYKLWRKRMYWGISILLILIILSSIVYVYLILIIESIAINVKFIKIDDINNNGIIIDMNQIQVDLSEINWINGMKFSFSDDIKVSNDNENEVMNIGMKGRQFEINLTGNVWEFEIMGLNVDLNSNELPKIVNGEVDPLYVDFKIDFHGINIPIRKSIMLNDEKLSKITNGLINEYLITLQILEFNLNKYDENNGIFGDLFFSIEGMDMIPRIDMIIGFNINETFYEFVNMEVWKFNKNKDIFQCQFNLPNVKKEIIENGIINDLIWRLFNDDSEIDKFKIAIKGKDICHDNNDNNYNNDKIPLWLCNTWSNVDLEIMLSIYQLVKFKSYYDYNSIPIIPENEFEIEKLLIGSNNSLFVSSEINTVYKDSIINEFEIDINGEVSFSGLKLRINGLKIIRFINNELKIMIQNVDFDIINVFKAKEVLEYIIYEEYYDYEFTDDMKFDINSMVNCKFFNGEIKLKGDIKMNVKWLIKYLIGIYDRGNALEDKKQGIELVEVEYIEGDLNYIKFEVGLLIYLPSFIKKVVNNIELINLGIKHEYSEELFEIQIGKFENFQNIIPISMKVSVNNRELDKRIIIDKFVGEFISGIYNSINITGIEYESKRSVFGVDDNLCELVESIEIPFNISSSDFSGGNEEGGNYFIRETTMHIMNKEVEITFYNPIKNADIEIEIIEGEAICEGNIIGYLKEKNIKMNIKPGIWKSPLIKIEYAKLGSTGWKIIQRAMEGNGEINNMIIRSIVKVRIGNSCQWRGMNILYESNGSVNGKVRW